MLRYMPGYVTTLKKQTSCSFHSSGKTPSNCPKPKPRPDFPSAAFQISFRLSRPFSTAVPLGTVLIPNPMLSPQPNRVTVSKARSFAATLSIPGGA